MSGFLLMLYRVAGGLAALFGIPYLYFFRRSELRERLGGSDVSPKPGCLWIHAASIGEAQAADPVIRAWCDEYGAESILVSCTNRTARERLREKLPEGARTMIAPLDIAPCVKRALRREQPACIVFVETEIWPAWIHAASEQRIPMAVVNGRISDRTYPRYRFLKPLIGSVVSRMQIIGCRTEEDRRRWIDVGAPVDRCFAWGNTKYEVGPYHARPRPAQDGELFLLVAGSVREGEEKILDLSRFFDRSQLRLIIAPRHLNRLVKWEEACLRRLLPCRRLSHCGLEPLDDTERIGETLRGADEGLPQVILVDQMGLLVSLYQAADAAFVGGSWAPIGGHNLFEPAREGVPVFFGTSITTVRDVANALMETGGGSLVPDVGTLANEIEQLRSDPHGSKERGEAARAAAEMIAGGAARTIQGLKSHGIPPGRSR